MSSEGASTTLSCAYNVFTCFPCPIYIPRDFFIVVVPGLSQFMDQLDVMELWAEHHENLF
jgi:hypothetical protein